MEAANASDLGLRSGTDRRPKKLLSLHLPERRTGFDRRKPRALDRMVYQLAQRPLDIAGLLLIVVSGNMLDAMLTWYSIQIGIATEANPFLQAFLDGGFLPFLTVKMAITAAIVFAIWFGRRYRLVLILLIALVIVYTSLVSYEIAMIALRPL